MSEPTPKPYSLLDPIPLEPIDERVHQPEKKSTGSGLWFLFGLLALQLFVLAAALLIVFSKNGSPAVESSPQISALTVPSFRDDPASPALLAQNNTLAIPPTPVPLPSPTAQSGAVEPAQPLALKIRGVELTQGIQVLQEPQDPRCNPNPTDQFNIFCNNSMPMVAGRHTMLRVYLACAETCPSIDPQVELRLLKDGVEQEVRSLSFGGEALQRVHDLSLPDLRAKLDHSVNFAFLPPPEWLQGQITFELTALTPGNPDKAPATYSLTKEFVRRKPLRIAYLPIEYNHLRPPDPVDVDFWLLRMYPVPAVEYFRLPMPDMVLQGELNKGEILNKLLYTYWMYAQYRSNQAHPDQLFGWLPMELYNGGASDPFWCPNCAGPHSSRVAFGGLRPETDIGGPRILAHEIAHNLGALHAWSPTTAEDAGCFKTEGADIRVDPSWPYPYTPHIQEFGIDLYSDPPVIHPPTTYDMMAYCADPWISPHTYRKIFDSPFLQLDGAMPQVQASLEAEVQPTGSGTLMVTGIVYPNGNVSQPEIIRMEGDSFDAGFMPPRLEGDDYCLEVWGHNGSKITQRCFEAGFVDLESGLPTESSAYFIPFPEINPDDVARITVTNPQQTLSEVAVSNHAPEIRILQPAGGTTLKGRETIIWEGLDADGDALTYDLLYSPDGGRLWLPLAVQLRDTRYSFHTSQIPATTDGHLRLIARDGFNTTTAELSASVTVQGPPPNSLILLGPTVVQPDQTFEVDVVAYAVTQPGLLEVQFELPFDSSALQVVEVRSSAALDLPLESAVQGNRVTYAAGQRERVEGLTGQITLATLTLKAGQQLGDLTLTPQAAVIEGQGGEALPVSNIEGLTIRVAP
ncbi:MAG TPA: hypothetical protein PKE64_03110 [Anaerolineae bacterium]|nr:hypothetical protein [Anaerolineae bacterium]